MSIVGLDLSLTSTGVALDGGTFRIRPKNKGVERLRLIRGELQSFLADMDAVECIDLVVIEGYSFGSRGRAVFNIGELGGVVRVMLHEESYDFVEVPPTSLKKFATGKGNAPKDAVLASAIRAGFRGDNNDEADAWWLWKMGYAILGDEPKYEYQRQVIAAIKGEE